MKADAKKVLIGMIDKAADNTASDVLLEKRQEQIEKTRREVFLKALFANPAAYITIDNAYCIDDSDVLSLNNAQIQKLAESIIKKYPMPEDEQTERVDFAALSHHIYVRKDQVKKFSKLAEEIDVAVVTGEATDLYNLLKKALG